MGWAGLWRFQVAIVAYQSRPGLGYVDGGVREPSQTTAEASAIHDQTIAVLGQAVTVGPLTVWEDGTMQDFHQVYVPEILYLVVPSLENQLWADEAPNIAAPRGTDGKKSLESQEGAYKSTVTNFLRQQSFLMLTQLSCQLVVVCFRL